ncbi:MAG: asparagine synthase-related protein, partial [bacterium]
DELFCDAGVCATRSHINIIQTVPQPYSDSGIHAWLDGEFYNRKELGKDCSNAKSDAQILVALYKKHKDFSFLKDIDGFYSASLYDVARHKVFLITDRYGVRHIYWTVNDGNIAWSSEVKAFLALPEFSPKIDPGAVREFFSVGYLLEDRTWFENVKLLPSGTVLTWDLKEQKHTMRRYWWWDAIKPMNGKIEEKEIAEELGRLFIKSVETMSGEDERIGVPLSGGLDSRAILAAVPERKMPVNTITFGNKSCDDALIAAMASRVKGAVHQIFEINEKNWFGPRLKCTWITDGQLNLLHMHGFEARAVLNKHFQVVLNGFAGDLVLGGGYLKNENSLDVPIDENRAVESMGCAPDIIPDLSDYQNLQKTDFFFLQNRVRRFTSEGTRHVITSVVNRNPFFYNELLELSYSLPDSLRYKSRIYKTMLLHYFPEFFRKIPWQKSGIPIGRLNPIEKALYFPRRARTRLSRKMRRLGLPTLINTEYTNYPKWIRSEPASSFFKKTLDNHDALFPEYTSRDRALDCLSRHFSGQDRSEMLCRYVTFELWLQRVFNKNSFE